LATCVYRSTDGGKTFEGFKGAPGGDDPQQLWIDPSNRTHILLGGDQGATVSLDAGKTWGSWYNQPTGQVYHVSTDTQFPYWVYATQQDSGCIGTSSRGNLGAITPMDWLPHPGNEGGYIVVDPLNPKVSYAVGPIGGIMKVTYPSGQWVQVEPGMSPESGFRGFSTQMAFSPTNKHELMVGYQYLMSTTDGGVHWTKLSPDLSVDPLAKKPANPNMPMFAAINSFSASPVAPGVIWAGTSNGLVYVTKNHGKTWDDVTLSRLPSQRAGVVRCIEASPQEAGSAYLAIGGFGRTAKAHVYRTHDFGSSWSEIDKGIPQSALDEGGLVAIRADGKQAGLLFGLTGKDVLVSTDDGGSWQSLNLNLPTTSFSDLTIHENDLVLGTYGRGIWILDDYAPLRQISAKTVAESAHLFKPSTAYRLRRNVNGDTPFPPEVPHAENPPLGAIIYYSLAAKPTGEIKLEIVDAHGRVVRHLSSAPAEPYDDPAPLVPSFWIEKRKPLPTDIGLNRINWNVRFDTPPAFTHDVSDVMGAIAGDTPAAIEGPLALPGEYTVRLTVDGKVMTQPLIVKNDPRSPSTRRDLVQENTFRLNIYAGIVEAWDGYHQAVELRAAIAKVLDAKPSAEIAKAAKTLDAKLAEVAGTVYRERRFYGPPPATSFVNLNGYLLAHLDAYDYGDMAPNEAMKGAYGSDWAKLHAVTEQWRAILAKDVPAFNSLLRKGGLAAIAMPTNPLIDPPAPARQYLPPKAVGDGGGGTN